MSGRRFHVQQTHEGYSVLDGGAHPWAVVPRGAADPEACAETLLAIVRKVYGLGLADAYAGTARSFHVRKGDDGEGLLTWDLISVAKEVRRVGSLPRTRFRILPDKARNVLAGLAPRVHAAALADGRKGAGAGLGGFLAEG